MARPLPTIGVALALLFAVPAFAAASGDDDLEINVGASAARPAAKPAPIVAPAPPPAPAPAPQPDATAELRKEIDDLRQRISTLENKPPPPPPAPSAADAFLKGLRFGGYIQVQYGQSDLSENQISPDGASLNQNAFVVRRARLDFRGEWDFSGFFVQLDGNTVNGASVGLRQAEAYLFWRNANAGRPPYIQLTAGLTKIPFGFELPERERDLIFMERSTSSLAFFTGPQDVGAEVSGGLGPFRYALAIMGGSPASSGVTVPLTTQPTYVGRLGAAQDANSTTESSGGVSFLSGTGLSQGSAATKNTLQWDDLNENGVVDNGETIGIAGSAARPSVPFQRWAVNVDFEAGVHSRIGWTRLWLEATLASNLDRGLFVADPVFLGRELRETGLLAAIVQEISRYAFVGLRFDLYNPDSDFLYSQRGVETVTSQNITTIAPLAGVVLPGRGKLSFQYNIINNAEGVASNGVPTNLLSNNWTVRLQEEF